MSYRLGEYKRAYHALLDGDATDAKRILAEIEDDFAWEVTLLIRAGQYGDAANRLARYLNPKFPTVSACEHHVGEPNHFRQDQ